jgi:hypothetical protein
VTFWQREQIALRCWTGTISREVGLFFGGGLLARLTSWERSGEKEDEARACVVAR